MIIFACIATGIVAGLLGVIWRELVEAVVVLEEVRDALERRRTPLRCPSGPGDVDRWVGRG